MKTRQIIFVFFILLGLGSLSASSTLAANMRAEKVEKANKTQVMEKATVRAQVTARHAERLERRFGLYHEKLNNFISRIENKAKTMADNGSNTSAALAKLTEAKEKLATAKSAANISITSFNSIEADEFEMQNNSALAAKNKAQEARQSFKEVRSLLVEAIRLLKN